MNILEGKLGEFIRSQLSVLDTRLSEVHEPVHRRPMMAAMLFAKECMVSINDEPIGDEFLEQSWFGDLLAIATQWYRDRFGNELLDTPPEIINGVIAAFGTPLSLQIPCIPKFDTDKPAIIRIVFADGVLAEEDPMKWITPTPTARVLHGDTELRKQVVRIANSLRQVYHRVMVAELMSADARELASSIQGHLEKAAADIRSGQHGLAVWELHLCVEKALKVFLRQSGARIPQSHNLTKLVADAEQVGLPSCSHLNFQQLPHHGDAIRHRYAELAAPTFEETMEIYEIVIRATAHIASAFKQSAFAKHKEFYIKALSWHPKWKQGQPKNTDK